MSQIVTLDFETYYDKHYTLRKMSTSEYVRDRRFEAISCSIKIGDGKSQCHFGEAIRPALDAIDWKDSELLAHHTQFDGFILSHHYKIYPAAYRDTLSMARALFPKSDRNNLASVGARLGVEQQKLEMPDFQGKHLIDLTPQEREQVGIYNDADVESCRQIYDMLLQRMPSDEMDLIDVTVRMFARPLLLIDKPRAKIELQRELVDKQAKIAASGVEKTVLSSRQPFADALTDLGVQPPMKVSKTTRKLTYAFAQTDIDFTALEHHSDERVRKLVVGRLAATSTIGETRAKRLLQAGRGRWRVPVYLNYCGAHTTRWSGGDKLNFQNLPRYDPKVPHSAELRRSILAPKGQVLVVVDSAQIECRVLAWLAGEKWLLDKFAAHGDPYCAFGYHAYGRKITKADIFERDISKKCVLGLGYGMGAPKLNLQMMWGGVYNVPLEVCEGLVKTYRGISPNIVALWGKCGHIVHDMHLGVPGDYKCLSWDKDKIVLPSGLSLHYSDVISSVQEGWGSGIPQEVEAPRPRNRGMLVGTSAKSTESVRFVDQSYQRGAGRSKLYGGLVTENITQAVARVIVGEQMRLIAQRYKVVMMSHDEVVYLARERDADEALKFGLAIMRTPPKWAPDIPIDAAGDYDVRYSK